MNNSSQIGVEDHSKLPNSSSDLEIDELIEFQAIDIRSWELSHQEKYLLSSFEGLINKEREPILFIDNQHTFNWLLDLSSTFYSVDWLEFEDLESLLNRYRNIIKGVILWDDLPESANIATPLTGVHNAVMIHQDLYEKINNWDCLSGKSIIVNLTQEYKNAGLSDQASNADIYQWAFKNYYPLSNPSSLAIIDNGLSDAIRSQLCGDSVFTMWQPMYCVGEKDPKDSDADLKMFESIIANTPQNIVVYGYMKPYGCNEHPVVAKLTEFGKYLIPTDFFHHMPFWSRLPIPDNYQFSQEESRNIENVPLKNKLYVAGIYSDGDNLQYVQGFMKKNLWDNHHGTVPTTYEISPSIYNLAPAMGLVYYETMTSNDYFVSGVGGKGYVKADYASPQYFDDFWNDTSDLMVKLDQRELRSWDSGELSEIIQYYTDKDGEKKIDSIIEGYLGVREFIPELVDGIPFMRMRAFSAESQADYSEEKQFLLDILDNKNSEPLFLTLHLHCWSTPYQIWADFVNEMEELKNNEIVFVTSGQLSQLMLQASLPTQSNLWKSIYYIFMIGLISIFIIKKLKFILDNNLKRKNLDLHQEEDGFSVDKSFNLTTLSRSFVLLSAILTLNLLTLLMEIPYANVPLTDGIYFLSQHLVQNKALPYFLTEFELILPIALGSGTSLLVFDYIQKRFVNWPKGRIWEVFLLYISVVMTFLIISYYLSWIQLSLFMVSSIVLLLFSSIIGLVFFVGLRIVQKAIK